MKTRLLVLLATVGLVGSASAVPPTFAYTFESYRLPTDPNTVVTANFEGNGVGLPAAAVVGAVRISGTFAPGNGVLTLTIKMQEWNLFDNVGVGAITTYTPAGANGSWSFDIAANTLAAGKVYKFKTVAVVNGQQVTATDQLLNVGSP